MQNLKMYKYKHINTQLPVDEYKYKIKSFEIFQKGFTSGM